MKHTITISPDKLIIR